MKEITMAELLDMFDVEVHTQIIDAAAKNMATHVVVFENLDMCSSQLGRRTALCVGPECSITSPEGCEGNHLHDLPSQRQYPVAYASVGLTKEQSE